MPVSKRHAKRRADFDKATAGGILLRPDGPGTVIRSGGTGTKVRNVETGRVLPCCYTDCMNDGNDRHRVEVPHDTPRWKDEATGKQEMLVYIFCTELHKSFFIQGLASR